LARGVDVGFEFSVPMPQFWRAREVAQVLIGKKEEACA
jgi:hypothetical protein